jgi:phosphoribosyl-dephospho-CoA transferase
MGYSIGEEGNMEAARQLSSLQFFNGVMAALTLRGMGELTLRNSFLDKAFEAAYEKLSQEAEEHGVSLMFRIKTDALTGESRTLRDVIPRAAQLRIVSLDNPSFQSKRIVMDAEVANRAFDALPLPRACFEASAAIFAEKYMACE